MFAKIECQWYIVRVCKLHQLKIEEIWFNQTWFSTTKTITNKQTGPGGRRKRTNQLSEQQIYSISKSNVDATSRKTKTNMRIPSKANHFKWIDDSGCSRFLEQKSSCTPRVYYTNWTNCTHLVCWQNVHGDFYSVPSCAFGFIELNRSALCLLLSQPFRSFVKSCWFPFVDFRFYS